MMSTRVSMQVIVDLEPKADKYCLLVGLEEEKLVLPMLEVKKTHVKRPLKEVVEAVTEGNEK